MPSGSVIPYQGKRGRTWRIKYRDAEGRQIMETIGSERDGITEKQAQAELRERLVRVDKKGWRRPQRLLFRDYAEDWFEATAAKRSWSKNTRRAYRAGLKRIQPFFGPMTLGAVKPSNVAAFTREAIGRYGPTTVNQDLNLLHNIFASAVREELIDANPAHRPERPKTPDHERAWRVLEPGEVSRVLGAFKDERASVVFLTSILTAMRRSELVNLRWSDVDFLADAIYVRRAKSREGHRSIAMSKTLSDALWAWKASTAYQADEDYVFASPDSGRRMNPDRWWGEHWRAALKSAGVEGYVRPFHDSRHSALTHMAAGGSSPVAIHGDGWPFEHGDDEALPALGRRHLQGRSRSARAEAARRDSVEETGRKPVVCGEDATSCSFPSVVSPLDFAGVELIFHQLDDLFLAGRLLVLLLVIAAVLADGEVQRELPAGDLIERFREQRRVLRLLGELPVERGGGRELDGEPVVGELRRVGLAEHRGRRDRALLDRGQDRPLPGLLELLQLE
jgi:integrase